MSAEGWCAVPKAIGLTANIMQKNRPRKIPAPKHTRGAKTGISISI